MVREADSKLRSRDLDIYRVDDAERQEQDIPEVTEVRLDFGKVEVGKSATRHMDFKNTEHHVQFVSLKKLPSDFIVNMQNFEVMPGEKRRVLVTWWPKEVKTSRKSAVFLVDNTHEVRAKLRGSAVVAKTNEEVIKTKA